MAIKIKKANRGKFNATKARTGKTTEELTHSTNPVTKKRAIFAQNAAKWKHEDGGKTKVKDLAEEGFNPLNRNHWAINPTRVIDALQKDNNNTVSNKDVVKSMGFLYGLAGLNRLLPFIKNSPLAIPLKSLAYNQMIKSASAIKNPIDESTDSASGDIYRGTMSGDTTRNLNKQYLYGNQPAFEKADSTVITSKYPDRYAKLYPNAEKYIMKSSIPHKDSIDFAEVADFFADNHGMSPSILANKIKSKQNIRVSDDNGWSPVHPLDDVSGHSVELNMKGHPTLVTQDLWKFNPKDYTTRWGSTEYKTLLAQKESAILDKLGNPFYLVQNNPIKNFSTNVDSLLKARYPYRYNNKEGISTNFKDGGNFSPNMIREVTVTGKKKKPTIPFVPSTILAIDTNPGIKIPMAYPESDITVSRKHIDRVNEGRDPKFRSLVPEQIDRYNMYDPHIKKAAYETGVDPKLIKNIMLVETGMKPRTNSLGYSGFAQTNQASIDTVNRAMGTNFTVDQMNDPYQAAKYIANYLKHTSNVHGASKIDELLVGYNWGPARINRYRKGAKLPAETEDYIKKFKGLLSVDETFNPNTDNTMSLGGILSVANMALDLYNQAEAKANARTADSFKNNMEARQKFVNDAEYLKGYNQSGSSRVEFYRNGGMHNLNARTMGNIGKFKKVGPNIFKVKGPKHSEGGVRMGNAEVEGGETVKITPNEIKVLSDNKKLFGYSPSVKLADRVSFGDPRIDREFERQFRIQESIKKFRGVDNADMKAKDGNTFKLWDTVPKILKDFSWSKLFDGSGKTSGKKFSMPEAATDDPLKLEDWMTSTTSGHWMDKEPSTPAAGMPMVGDPNAKLNTKSSLGDMAPMLIDNIGNLIMDLNRPKIPTPVMMPPVKFKTDIDVNPQINAITSANRGAVSDINRNISDANVATALRMKLANQEGMSKQQILAGETNTETDLFNKQASANLYPNMINTNKINEYAEDTVNRKLGIQASLSQNLGNLARDFTHAIDTKNLRNLDKNRLKAELFKDTDAQLDRAIMFSDIFDDIIATDYQELLNNANLDPRIAKALAYRYNKMQKQ